MATPKPPNKRPGSDRHTQQRFKVSFHPEIRKRLEVLARDNHSDISEEIRNAVRFYLRHLGYLPPLGHRPEHDGA